MALHPHKLTNYLNTRHIFTGSNGSNGWGSTEPTATPVWELIRKWVWF